ncbi:hypothetical protein, partial [Rhodopirellula bahusiensis]|uniref:hypothetical protein n=1 Tax=Rhodopirellula bahusiensis TaxID=2014065 RepID=UPI003266C3CC
NRVVQHGTAIDGGTDGRESKSPRAYRIRYQTRTLGHKTRITLARKTSRLVQAIFGSRVPSKTHFPLV